MFVWPLTSLRFALQDYVNGNGRTSSRCLLRVNHYHHRRRTWYSAGHHYRGWSVCLRPQEDDAYVRLRANQLTPYGTSPAPTHANQWSLTPDWTIRTITRYWWCAWTFTQTGWKHHVVFLISTCYVSFFKIKSSDYLILFRHEACSVSHNNNNSSASIISFKTVHFSWILISMQMFREMEVLRDSDFCRFSVSCSSDVFRRTVSVCCTFHFVNIDLNTEIVLFLPPPVTYKTVNMDLENRNCLFFFILWAPSSVDRRCSTLLLTIKHLVHHLFINIQ